MRVLAMIGDWAMGVVLAITEDGDIGDDWGLPL